MRNTARTGAVSAALSAALVVGGCAVNTATVSAPLSGLDCIDDSLDCIGKRQATLRHLVADESRAWVRQAPTPQAYASGVRLFAYRKTKTKLSCQELTIGRREAENAEKILRGADFKPAQVSRGTMFAAEVARELKREWRRRCKSKA